MKTDRTGPRVLRAGAVWLVRLAVTVLGVLTLLFFLLRLSGDPAAVLVGPGGTLEDIERVRRELGLDLPLWTQYGAFLGDVARLDFGVSAYTGEPAISAVLVRLPLTLQVVGATLALALLIGVPLGMLAAARARRPSGRAITAGAAAAQAVPNFVLGMLLLLVFALWLGWLPSYGSESPLHSVLPTLTLAAFTVARVVRLVRAGLLEALSQDFIRTVLAKGGSRLRVLARHALPNAFPPVLAFLVVDSAYLLSSTVIVEQLYAYDGIGKQLVDAIFQRDYPIVQATVFVVAVLVVAVSAVGDVLGALADPRVRREAAG
ncbi:ABC transporter permease [Streptosporangium amethystogenes subsp. fukuiense]|uniref:ABC transporter permease n=1 Tax=Streptosporangium amethystogenes subsp. fukuiense TaxID=698418 RepID=A0ABW2SU67_9ACTN